MSERINFARMWEGELEAYAEKGFQRAQYYLGKSFLDKRFSTDITKDPERLALAEKWLLAAIRNPGIDPDDTKQRGDMKKYRDMAKQELSGMYSQLAWRNRDTNIYDRYNPQYNEQGMEYVLKVVELGVNPHFSSTAAMQYLRGGIPHLGEGNTGDRGRKFAIDLLVNAEPLDTGDSEHDLSELYKETGAQDIRVALGQAKVLSSYKKLGEHWSYRDSFEEGFKIIEEVGNHEIHGYEGYKRAKAVLDSLESIARESIVVAEKERVRTHKRYVGLGKDFAKYAEQLQVPVKTSPLLERVIKARQFIETSKMGSDADFDARPA